MGAIMCLGYFLWMDIMLMFKPSNEYIWLGYLIASIIMFTWFTYLRFRDGSNGIVIYNAPNGGGIVTGYSLVIWFPLISIVVCIIRWLIIRTVA